ncbi:MAG: CoA-binding protein [Candidatus Scalindua rubra]|uniref:CoA-binding protein n=1 Tax=Candidatus Scalindua rubra TaxID=1872076 RepID=A0A1E3XFG0_9BACT|nr:MAG: CoA-binding protein [Candidatus Scalindua rubra]
MGKESLRYIQNAKEILKAVSIEGNNYTDRKPIREAFGVAYLAILEAINEALIKKGLSKKDLPKSVDGYRNALRKYLAIHNGKLMREFESLYDSLHIAGYYRGLLYNTAIVKDALKAAEAFIKKVK